MAEDSNSGAVKVQLKTNMGEITLEPVSYTHLRAHETPEHLVCRLLLEKNNTLSIYTNYNQPTHISNNLS